MTFIAVNLHYITDSIRHNNQKTKVKKKIQSPENKQSTEGIQ